MSQRLDYQKASPAAIKTLAGVHEHVAQSTLSPVLLELVNLRVSLINGCAFCIDLHTRGLQKNGMRPDKVALVPVWYETDHLFDDRERAALAWAEVVTTVASSGVSDDAFAAAAKIFEPRELTDLTVAIGLVNTYNRLGVAFRPTPAALRHAGG
jgi:AhpD family alkylhydroperoxidase